MFPGVGQQTRQNVAAEVAERETANAAEHREEQAFCEQLAKDARSARADGETDTHFAPALRAARQQEVGEVGAGQQNDKAGECNQYVDGFLEHAVGEVQAAAAIREVEARHGLARHHLRGGADRRLELHVKARLGGSITDAGVGASHHIDPPEVGRVEEIGLVFGIDDGLQAERHVEVWRLHHVFCAGESAGSYADDGDGNLVERDDLSQRSRRAAIVAQPDRVANDSDISGSGCGVVGGLEGAAKLRGDFEYLEIIACDHGGVDAPGGAVDGGVHAVFLEREEVAETLVVCAKLLVDGERKHGAGGP